MKIIRIFFPFILIILLAIFWFNATLILPAGKMIYGGDIYDAYFYWKNYLYVSIREGIIPFWNPYNFSGTPFLAHPNINIFYPPNWLFVLLPANLSFSYYFFIHIIIAAFSMYYLVRSYTDRWGAMASAITYAFGGFFAARIYAGHLEYVDAASWVPLVFALSKNFIINISTKNFILTVTGFSILILCGNELFLLFTLIFVFLYLLYYIVIKTGFRSLKKNIRLPFYLFIILILSFGIAAIEVLPRIQFILLSIRSHGIPYNMASSGSLPLDGLKLLVDPFYWGSPFPEKYTYHGLWPNMFEYTHYVGLIPYILMTVSLIIIIFSVITKKLRKIKYTNDYWFFLLIAIPVFLLISFGYYVFPNIHELLWQYTPFYKGIRFPARHLFGVVLSLSVLTGMSMGFFKNKIVKIFFIILIIIDLFNFNRQFIRISPYPNSTYDRELLSLLKTDKEQFRFLPDFPVVAGARRDLDFGASVMYKINSTSDYNSMILWRYYHFIDIANKTQTSSIPFYNVEIPPLYPWSPFVDYLNIKYVMSDKWGNYIGSETYNKYKMVLESDKYALYENLRVSKRFNLVNEIKIYDNIKMLEKALKEENLDLSKTVLFNKEDNDIIYPVNLGKCNSGINGEVKIVSNNANNIRLSTVADCDSILTTSEVFYPGWKAKIDGDNTPIYLSNTAFKSVFVPKGIHTIELYYSPDIYYLGGMISGISLILLTTLYLRFHKK